MTPLQIEILLRYNSSGTEYRDGDFSAPAVRQAIDDFGDRLGMLAPSRSTDIRTLNSYVLTPRGQAFIDHICALPLPECVWTIPAGSA